MSVPSQRTYLVVEAWRECEEATGAPMRDPAIEQQALSCAGSFEDRIVVRAAAFAAAHGLEPLITAAGRRLRLTAYAVLASGFLLGIGAAHALPDGFPARANVVALLLVLIAPNLTMLLVWASVLGYGSWRGHDAAAAGWIGRRTLAAYRLLNRHVAITPQTRAAALSWSHYLLHTPAGHWRLSQLTHGFWLALTAGALLACWWLMVIHQIDFLWGSTLLSEQQVQALLTRLTHAVASVGFAAPEAADIAASRVDLGAQTPELRQRWGLFVIGSLVLCGLLPRTLAAIISVLAARHRDRRLSLDLTRPGYARLRPLLAPLASVTRVLDADEAAVFAKVDAKHGIIPTAAALPPQAVWLSLERAPRAGVVHSQVALDLGVVATRADQERVLAALARSQPVREAVVIVADIAITPDRGVTRFLSEIAARAACPAWLLLDGAGSAAAWRAADRETRCADWSQAAGEAGITQVLLLAAESAMEAAHGD